MKLSSFLISPSLPLSLSVFVSLSLCVLCERTRTEQLSFQSNKGRVLLSQLVNVSSKFMWLHLHVEFSQDTIMKSRTSLPIMDNRGTKFGFSFPLSSSCFTNIFKQQPQWCLALCPMLLQDFFFNQGFYQTVFKQQFVLWCLIC